MVFAASALSRSDVWVVGDQESGNGMFETLAEHWDGHAWSVVPTPDPGVERQPPVRGRRGKPR